MYKIIKTFFSILVVFFFVMVNTFSYEKYVDFELIKEAGAPRFVKDGVLFTLPENFGQDLYIRTNLDNWKTNHYFEQSLYNVNYLYIEINEKVIDVHYKLNADGFWILDPYNDRVEYDSLGMAVSSLRRPVEEKYYKRMPLVKEVIDNIKIVRFRYRNPDASEVNLVCSVDNWCLYSHPMVKNENNYWEIDMKFSRGTFFYYFFVDGRKVTDIDNPDKYTDKRKGLVSYFILE